MSLSDEEILERFPDLPIDHDTKAFYAGWLKKKLLINRCEDCGRMHHPPKSLCPDCWSSAIRPVAVSGAGTVYLKVGLYQGPVIPEVDYKEPHIVVTVELVEQRGLRLSGALSGSASAVEIGSAVHLAWETRRGSPYPVWEAGAGA